MAILTCSEIKKEIKKGNIEIKPFNEKNLNPNGYNITLADEIVVYKNAVLDAKKVNETETLKIPEEHEDGKKYGIDYGFWKKDLKKIFDATRNFRIRDYKESVAKSNMSNTFFIVFWLKLEIYGANVQQKPLPTIRKR